MLTISPSNSSTKNSKDTRDNTMIILITGSRHYNNKKLMASTLSKLHPITLIIHGAAQGADLIAQEYAENHNIPTCQHLTNRKLHGRKAAHIRNQAMLDSHPNIGLMLAFPISNRIGAGDMTETWNMVRKAHALNIPVKLVVEGLTGYNRRTQIERNPL